MKKSIKFVDEWAVQVHLIDGVVRVLQTKQMPSTPCGETWIFYDVEGNYHAFNATHVVVVLAQPCKSHTEEIEVP